MNLFLTKVNLGLIPADIDSEIEYRKIKLGATVKVKITNPRNIQFHRKYFALLNFAFEHWTPPELDSNKWNITPEKSFDRFRKDLIIMAGYYDATHRLDGSVRIEAKSISFANMTADNFAELYSNTIDAVLKHILTNYSRDDLDDTVEQLMLGFA